MQEAQARAGIWRIPYIPHTAPGGAAYVRAYGWGYLSWPGVLMIVIGATALALGRDAPWKLAMIFGGFVVVAAGIVLNGLSERRRMPVVPARCEDVEIQHLPGLHLQRSAGYAVRARMRYRLGDCEYEATPGRLGYDLIGSRARAEAFAEYLRAAASVPLHVDARHPTRALFKHLIPPSPQPSR
jgi:hypothetical protein